MFRNIYNKIFKTNGANYDANGKQGFGSSGSSEPDQPTPESGNNYSANANTAAPVNVDGGRNNIDRDAKNVMSDIADWHTNATQELLGNPQVVRPSKNKFQNVDAQLAATYYGNMK